MLRIHLMQNWFGLSDPAMEEALYEVASMRQFAGLSLTRTIPDETTILNFRRLLEATELAARIFTRINAHLTRQGLLLRRGTMVDVTIISAPSSTKNADGERDPEMHQTCKGKQWYFGMKAHIGADVDSGLGHTVVTTPANEADIEVVDELLHGKEEVAYAELATLARSIASHARVFAGRSRPDAAVFRRCPRVVASAPWRPSSIARPASGRASSIRSG